MGLDLKLCRQVPMVETMHGFYNNYVSKKSSVETILHNASLGGLGERPAAAAACLPAARRHVLHSAGERAACDSGSLLTCCTVARPAQQRRASDLRQRLSMHTCPNRPNPSCARNLFVSCTHAFVTTCKAKTGVIY